eukprot:1135522-Prorocentrum_minimum.AAC.1
MSASDPSTAVRLCGPLVSAPGPTAGGRMIRAGPRAPGNSHMCRSLFTRIHLERCPLDCRLSTRDLRVGTASVEILSQES